MAPSLTTLGEMVRSIRSRLTYANIVASIALFVALGGGAYAAITLPAGSVGTKQIRDDAVRSAQVKSRSLLASDFKLGQLPTGLRGAQDHGSARGAGPARGAGSTGAPGATGPVGPQGEPGTSATAGAPVAIVRTAGPSAGNPSFSLAACEDHSPERATGGGGGGGPVIESVPWIADPHNGDRVAAAGEVANAWGVTVASGNAHAYVLCTS